MKEMQQSSMFVSEEMEKIFIRFEDFVQPGTVVSRSGSTRYCTNIYIFQAFDDFGNARYYNKIGKHMNMNFTSQALLKSSSKSVYGK
jgi:hypothetical protein